MTRLVALPALAMCLAMLMAVPAAGGEASASLDYGYRLMYGLDFVSASRIFSEWSSTHPLDPLGPISEAANLLFAELDRTGALAGQFYIDDEAFVSRKPPPAPAGLRDRFDKSLADGERLAKLRLRDNPRDQDALFALAMVSGLRGNWVAMIEGRRLAALSFARDASRWSLALREVAPNCADAYLATGILDYVVGSLFAPIRWMLRLAGYHGDKERGLEQLRITASRGRFLGPFARILLTIAYLRAHDTMPARELLAGLEREFPSNPSFHRELQRISTRMN